MLRTGRSESAALPTPRGYRIEQVDAVGDSPELICYDGSENARNAISAAAALPVSRGAVIVDVGPLALVADVYAAAGSGAADLDRHVDADALALADEGADLARQAGFRAEARAGLDTPTWRGVVGVADEIGAAVIVLGSRGLTGVRELVEGSLSHEVAEHARRPVLVVPPNEPPLS
jgi:nucleotide-binding universal stress UspA family protein